MSQATEKQQLYILRLLDEVGVAGIEIEVEDKRWWGSRTSRRLVGRSDVGSLSRVEASLVIDQLLTARDGPTDR